MIFKKYFSFYKLLNVVLRISGTGSKFLVFAILSKVFSDFDFGNYSLIISLITLTIFILGLDFYNFSVRDILKTVSVDEIRNKISSSILFYFAVYLIFVVSGLVIFENLSYTSPYVELIILLCITEHFSQEIYRLLVGFGKVLMANILLFIRTAGWSSLVVCMALWGYSFSVEYILNIWLIANFVTIIYVFAYLLNKNYKTLHMISLDYNWIFEGIKVSFVFFIATFFLKLIEYSNRFIVNYYLGEELTGIFTFFSSIAILITLYINTIVISFELPELIKSVNKPIINDLFFKFKKSLRLQIIVSVVIILAIIKPILMWQNKAGFQYYLPILFFLLFGSALMNYSLIYHFKLYIRHKDKSIAKILINAGVVSLLVCFLLTKYFGLYGASIAFAISGLYLHFLRCSKTKKISL
ncbi:oligosaccharide flippase family protein [Tamlana fucoidanivorans]|uniref:Polysaccharide biosynthesis protein C-terminal domain-containing protein n=1 Tax=Allotamlana fucoidanivorans TaxID=2583814 RepID=A0A5C4STF7_9FLAO|nr:oligosaccharide flippase family protein [Tamlana fucoidanivorans]TNJ47049.1 hypothetical protein FGF67_00550 [Tamlana fucoidanivorans]